jgi:acetate kinase
LRGAGDGVLQSAACTARVCGQRDHENHASCETH